MNVTFKRKRILAKCLSLSLFIHIGVACLLQHHALFFYSPRPQSLAPTTIWLASMSKQALEEILKTALTPSENVKPALQQKARPQKEDEHLSFRTVLPDLPCLSAYAPLDLPPPFDPHHLFVSNEEIVSSLPLPAQNAVNLPSHIPKDLLLPTVEEPAETPLPPPPSFHPEPPIAFQPIMPQVQMPSKLPEEGYEEGSLPLLSFVKPMPPAPPLHPPWFNLLPQLPTLEELDTASYSEEFDIDLVFAPQEEEKGYLFALTLIPKTKLHLPKIKQHYLFLIDRANSIQKERLSLTKNAIYKALEEIHPEDTFNIIAFDSKVEKLFPSQMPPTKSSLTAAQEFLHRIELGSFFSPADLYRPLLLTVPYHVAENEMYTAILLTDGDSLSKKNAQISLLQQWNAYNQGKVTLHVLGMTGDKHISFLETLCTLNRGQYTHSTTKRGLKRKLLKLMKTVQTPLVKNIACHAFSRSPNTLIEIFPDNSRSQHLYAGQPYTIFGLTDTIDDFVLFIQGRIKDRWLNIKKTVSFISARKGEDSLHSQWVWQKVHSLYKQYLLDHNPEHLAEARALINPSPLPLAFQ